MMIKDEFIKTAFQFFVKSNTMNHTLKQDTRPPELSQIQYNILEMIFFTPTKGISDFSECLGLSMPNASRETRKLVEKGFLTKEQSKDDRRKYLLMVTKKGQDTMNAVLEEVIRRINGLYPDMPESKQDELTRAMTTIVDDFFL